MRAKWRWCFISTEKLQLQLYILCSYFSMIIMKEVVVKYKRTPKYFHSLDTSTDEHCHQYFASLIGPTFADKISGLSSSYTDSSS